MTFSASTLRSRSGTLPGGKGSSCLEPRKLTQLGTSVTRHTCDPWEANLVATAATGQPAGAKAARIQHHVLFALRAITSTCSVSSALLLARCGRIATMPTTRKRSRSQGSMPASGSASSRPSGSQWQRSQPMAPSTWSSSPSGLLSTGSMEPKLREILAGAPDEVSDMVAAWLEGLGVQTC